LAHPEPVLGLSESHKALDEIHEKIQTAAARRRERVHEMLALRDRLCALSWASFARQTGIAGRRVYELVDGAVMLEGERAVIEAAIEGRSKPAAGEVVV
jgi:hypothetical protein